MEKNYLVTLENDMDSNVRVHKRKSHGNTGMLIYSGLVYSHFHSTKSELMSCNRDWMALKAQSIYFLTL